MKTKRNRALAVQFVAWGLKCDRPGCGYQDLSLKLTRKTN